MVNLLLKIMHVIIYEHFCIFLKTRKYNFVTYLSFLLGFAYFHENYKSVHLMDCW